MLGSETKVERPETKATGRVLTHPGRRGVLRREVRVPCVAFIEETVPLVLFGVSFVFGV